MARTFFTIFLPLIALFLLPSVSFADRFDRPLQTERIERMREIHDAEHRSPFGVGFEQREIERRSEAPPYRERRAELMRQADDCIRSASSRPEILRCQQLYRQRLRGLFSESQEHAR